MSSGFIEKGLSNEVSSVHRALASVQEELEAIDYYHQRADVSDNKDLKAILVHNCQDEMEHAAMLLEWLRRTMPEFDIQMRKFLFASGSPIALAAGAESPPAEGKGLGLGSLKSTIA